MDPWSWLGYATTKFHCSERTIDIPLKDGSQKTLKDICSSPAITPPCRLTPFLPGGHLQTMYTAVAKSDVPILYRRKVFDSDDSNYPGTFVVDFVSHYDAQTQDQSAGDADEGEKQPTHVRGNLYCPKRTRLFKDEDWAEMEKGSDDSTPMLVMMHGISGGSYEVYLKELLAPLLLKNEEDQQQWEACVVTGRGCAGSKVTSGVLFNARATWDYRQTVKWLRRRYPNRPLFGVGFSLGANILVNYLGEEGDRCELTAAVGVSNPWDLAASNIALKKTWVGSEIYQRTLGSNLKNLFTNQVDEFLKNPKVDVEKVLKSRYLWEFDRALQCPIWGYPTETAYYRDAASIESSLSVRTPFLAINAEDDPLAPPESLPYQEVQHNPYVLLCTTSMGGHLSWFELGGTRWFTKPATNFLRKFAEDVELAALRKSREANAVKAASNWGASEFEPLRRKLRYRSELVSET